MSAPLGRTIVRALALGLLAVASVIVAPASATADDLTPGTYTWEEAYFPSAKSDEIHADVIRPAGIPADRKTPVMLTVGAYRSHTAYISEPHLTRGPSTTDLHIADFLAHGYTYVIADVPSYGGSTGCPDWGGPTERAGVKAAVEWAATQPWSTGNVGMYGLSYEGFTGLMALAERPKGLAAVAASSPPADPYSYMYMQGIPFRFTAKPVIDSGVKPSNLFIAPEHAVISQTPGRPDDTDHYRANASSTPQACYDAFVASLNERDPNSQFWKDRDLMSRIAGNDTPTFITQGFLDRNTRADRVADLWNSLPNPENKAWFGQMGHADCYKDCRETYPAEILAFMDKHVAKLPVTVPGPKVTVGAYDGTWRSETAFPPADTKRVPITLRTGTYIDRGLIQGGDREIWTISPPLAVAQHLSGAPSMTASARGPANAPIAGEVFDIAPDGRATPITRGIAPLGDGQPAIRMLQEDWPIAKGHRIGVKITNTVDHEWAADTTGAQVHVDRAEVQLPLLDAVRHPDLTGPVNPLIAKLMREKTIQLPQDFIASVETPLDLPARHGG